MTIGEKVGQAGSYAREKASSARQRASSARGSVGPKVEENPVIALVGGLVLGAIAAAVLPRTQKEQQLLGPVGGKLTQSAKNAAQAAREAGQNKLGELGINKEAIGGAVKNLASSAAGAAKQAAAGGKAGGGSTGGSGGSGASSSGGMGSGSSGLAGSTETSTSAAVI